MNRLIISALVGIVAIVGFVVGQKTSYKPPNKNLPSIATDLNDLEVINSSISYREALEHRGDQYQDIQTITKLLQLPTDFSQNEALYVLAARSTENELRQLIQQAINVENRYDRSNVLKILFVRYVELDPVAATDHVIDIKLDVDSIVIPPMFMSWAISDLQGAITKANQISNTRLRRIAGNSILHSVGHTKPSILVATEKQLIDDHNLDVHQSEAIGILANSNPESAIQSAFLLKSTRSQHDAIRRVATVWARNDPAAALLFASNINNKDQRKQFISSVLNRWISDNSDVAIEAIRALHNDEMKDEFMQSALKLVAESDPRTALALADEMSNGSYTKSHGSILSTLSLSDPAAAFAALSNYPNQEELLVMISRRLGGSSTQQMMAWLDLMGPEQREQNVAAAASYLVAHDPRGALDLVTSELPKQQRELALYGMLLNVAGKDVNLAIEYLSELGTGPRADMSYRRLGQVFAQEDLESARVWLDELSGPARGHALQGVVAAVTASDPELGAQMIMELNGKDRQSALSHASVLLARSDHQAGLDWLKQFEHLPEYNAALTKLLPQIVLHQPNQALQLATQMDEVNRNRAVNMLMSQWAHDDIDAALAWTNRQPKGIVRDLAISSVVGSPQNSVDQMVSMIDQIDSDVMNNRAIMQGYMGLRQRGNIGVARDFLNQVSASQETRENIEKLEERMIGH